jgi:Flp pilus assembly protein TadG
MRIQLFCRQQSGSIAVEFALVVPIFLLILFGIVAFGVIISINTGVQQLVAEAARASVAGIDDGERTTLAKNFIAANARAYPFIDPSRLVTTTTAGPTTFQISATYDLSKSAAYMVPKWIPLPPPIITRKAIVQTGAF